VYVASSLQSRKTERARWVIVVVAAVQRAYAQ